MQQGKLTHAWTTAEASKPQGWKLAGVALGPTTDERDPMVILDAYWVAWATSPDGDRRDGTGDTPEQALYALARELSTRRGNPNG